MTGPGGTCGLGCCRVGAVDRDRSFGGGEFGTRMMFVVCAAAEGDGAVRPVVTAISVNILSSSENPLNVADRWTLSSISSSFLETLGVGDLVFAGEAGFGAEGVGTSLPATSATPWGSGVEDEELDFAGLRIGAEVTGGM